MRLYAKSTCLQHILIIPNAPYSITQKRRNFAEDDDGTYPVQSICTNCLSSSVHQSPHAAFGMFRPMTTPGGYSRFSQKPCFCMHPLWTRPFMTRLLPPKCNRAEMYQSTVPHWTYCTSARPACPNDHGRARGPARSEMCMLCTSYLVLAWAVKQLVANWTP